MTACYKCKKELMEVWEIGEIIRSYDGDDFCFCKQCKSELDEMNRMAELVFNDMEDVACVKRKS